MVRKFSTHQQFIFYQFYSAIPSRFEVVKQVRVAIIFPEYPLRDDLLMSSQMNGLRVESCQEGQGCMGSVLANYLIQYRALLII